MPLKRYDPIVIDKSTSTYQIIDSAVLIELKINLNHRKIPESGEGPREGV